MTRTHRGPRASTAWTAPLTTPPRPCPRPRHSIRCPAHTFIGFTPTFNCKNFQSLVNHHHSSCPKHGHVNLEAINASSSANDLTLNNGHVGGGDAPASQVSTSQQRRHASLQQDTKEILKNYRERAICIVSMIYHPPSLHQYRQLH